MKPDAPSDPGDTTLAARIDHLDRAETFERLRHDAAFFSDIRLPDERRFVRFAALFGADGKWDDGDGEEPLQGAEPIAAKLRTLPELFGLKLGLHLIGSPQMDTSAGGGSARWPMLCFVTSTDGVSGFVVGQYVERYGLHDGRAWIDHSAVEAAVMPTLADD